MALNIKLAEQLSKYVKLGSKVTYVERNNPDSKDSMDDPYNLLETSLKNNLLEVLQSIYDVSLDNKFNGSPFTVISDKNKFKVIDYKTAKSGDIKVTIKKTHVEITDTLTKLKTVIELKGIIEDKKSVVKPLKDQVIEAMKKAKDDKSVVEILENILNTK